MKRLFDKIETKDEKSEMYLESNLNRIKNKFSYIHNKYPRFFQYTANKEKANVNFKIRLMVLIFMINIIHCTIIYLSLI